MDINEEKCCRLLDGVELPRAARVLVSRQEKIITKCLKYAEPDIRIEYLMEMDLEAFIRQKSWTDDGCYDFIFDNGLLADMCMDDVLLRALGLHLKNNGKLRAVLPLSFELMTVGRCSFENNFNRGIFVSGCELGEDSFYVAEFSDFHRKVTWLQSFYTPELRRELAFLLQRIDFDVQGEKSLRDLQAFVQRYGIDKGYLQFYVDTAVVHKEKLYQLLRRS